ncbi:hypothetical protein AA0614_1346 [Komagataeibacter saccharivorans NRIC 0614]|nr:hypothetical protein AA0614_1346 [Komagataeibacter saccharivorans NRIC 0614]
MPLLAPCQSARGGQELPLHPQQRTGLIQKDKPDIRQPDPARQALEQKYAQFIFKLLDLLAQWRLFYAKLFRRTGETAVLGNCHEIS